MPPRFGLVTGGICSGLGKGVTMSSLGVVLQACGLRVTCLKIDPYLSIDASLLSPAEHGEVFVLDDGHESDLDLGNYERYMGLTLNREHNMTSGKVYSRVLAAERKGDYLGRTVQVIPHITDAIQRWIEHVAGMSVDGSGLPPDVCLIELGGTVGDIESAVFLEALRQFRFKVGSENIFHMHVCLVPEVGGEQKSKPTQHSVQALRSAGLQPDFVACRCARPLAKSVSAKIAMFSMVPEANVISVHDVANLYEVPVELLRQGLAASVLAQLRLPCTVPDRLERWEGITRLREPAPATTVTVAVVGKYTQMSDAYLSLVNTLKHACLAVHVALNVQWVEGESLEGGVAVADVLGGADAVLVPGGFGARGTEGKVAAVQYARERRVPFLGICLGLQLAVVEFCRNVLGWPDAHSAEFVPDAARPVVIFMPEGSKTEMGGTMRLGARRTWLRPDTLASEVYRGATDVLERHRHRYEVNPALVADMEAAGLVFSGKDDSGQRMEVAELRGGHPFFLCTQYHPEYKSYPGAPSPPFLAFITAAVAAAAGKAK